MRKIKLLLMMLLVATLARAQMLTPQVVASGGVFSSAGGYSLSQTYGEMAVQTLTNTNILTQGFQQPYPDQYVGITDPHDPTISIKLFPNPASDHVSVSILSDKDMDYRFKIRDALGRQISSSLYAASPLGMVYSIDVTKISAGMYFMIIESADKKFLQTILFNKN